ncbi:uncharacterized protein LOC105008185 [Esox lucius]|uniref:uncharacterized protein LOC105008185 n=1 Tax=Esox lucius TaxID=8010 RepID=UPI000577E471|nr:uncharacterized protein LOC105008185 [Esox lucius]
MLVVCVAVIFSLGSMCQTAPVSQTCETLLKPLEMKTIDPLIGKWSIIASSNNQPGAGTVVGLFMDNIWSDMSPGTHPDMLKDTLYMKTWDGRCSSYNLNMTLENNKLSWTYVVPSSAVFLPTCPDCLLTRTSTIIHGNTYSSLEFTSKRRELSASDLLQFKTQVDCLNLPAAVFLNTKTEHCPESTEPLPEMEDIYNKTIALMETDIFKFFLRATDYLIKKADWVGWL